MDLINELRDERSKKVTKVGLEQKLLINSDDLEKNRILAGLSKQSKNVEAIKKHGWAILEDKLNEMYDGDVFNIKQIKVIAVNYRLKFIRSHEFTGTFDESVIDAIKKFGHETNSPIDDFSLEHKYYILATKEAFENSRRNIHSQMIFYEIDKYNYKLVCKWGNDFTALRLLNGYKWRSLECLFMFWLFAYLPIVVTALACTKLDRVIKPWIFWFTSFFIAAVLSFFLNVWEKSENSELFSLNNWE